LGITISETERNPARAANPSLRHYPLRGWLRGPKLSTMTHRVLLIIGGGIAAYKSLLLIRELARRGIESQVILTKGGTEFVTALSAGALSGKPVFTDLWELDAKADMGHIELSRSADMIVVAPATENPRR